MVHITANLEAYVERFVRAVNDPDRARVRGSQESSGDPDVANGCGKADANWRARKHQVEAVQQRLELRAALGPHESVEVIYDHVAQVSEHRRQRVPPQHEHRLE